MPRWSGKGSAVTISDEQFGEPRPYHPDMTTLAAADLLSLGMPDTSAGATNQCLDELALAGIAEGKAQGPAGDAALAHLAGCGRCRRQLAALMALLGDPVIAREVARIHDRPRRARRPLVAVAGLVAVAAMVLLMVYPRGRSVDSNATRDPTITAVSAPSAIGPIGEVARPPSLIWSRVDGATSYRATLFDSTGTVLFELQLADTTTVIPSTVELVPQRAYLWKVEARTGWDRWSSSELFEFRVESAVRPPVPRTMPTPTPPAPSRSPASPPDSSAATRDLAMARAGEIRTRPDELRDAFRAALVGTMKGDSSSRRAQLLTAGRLASAYQSAWGDDFLVRELARFTGWSSSHREDKLWADSVRLAGGAAFGRDGPRAAIVIWRRALARALTVPDSGGAAALLGNIGAALARESQLDSARDYLTRAERLAESAGDLRVTANAVSELAGLSEERGDVAAARAQYAHAIELRKRTGDSRGLAADYNNIASLSRLAGDADGARQQLETALGINRRDGRTTAAATNLVNLASLAAAVGAFGRAGDDYREALAAWRASGDSAEAASALSGLGDLNLRRGDYPAALENFTAAVKILERTGPVTEALAARQGVAAALAAKGRLQDAIDELRQAQPIGESPQVAPEIRASLALARADLAMQLNGVVEAEALYATAAALYGKAGIPEGKAAAQHGLGMLYLAQGNTGAATAILEAALKTQTAANDGRSAAITRMALGGAAARAGDSALARRYLERATADLDRLGDPVAGAAVLSQRADLELAAGRFAAGESLYRAALARLGPRVVPDVGWQIHAGLATARAKLGGTDEAVRELRASIADIERVGSSLRLPERRSGALSDKWDVYQRLATAERDRGRVAESFAVSEGLRAREMMEMLALGRVAAPRDTAAGLVAAEQDLRRRIGELTPGVEGTAADRRPIRGPDARKTGVVSREALLQAQAAYTALQLEIRERAPRHAALVAPEAITWRTVAEKLESDEVMLEYLLSDAGSLVYVITRDTLAAIPLGVTHHDLARRVDFVRGALQPRGAALDSLWRAPLRQLHRDLLGPVEATGLLAGKTRLTIIPHAELHYLPFAALIESDGPPRFLVQRYRISVTPSASVWLALGKVAGRGTGLGTLALAPHLDQLPASGQEVARLAHVGGNARVLTGGEATEAAFRREAPTRRLIHLATYGVLNKQNPLFSFVDLAPDLQHDGRLEAHEVFGLKLVADLVVLSACQTALASGAAADVPAGDDWVGLSRAFLTAGAKNVMASLWAVQDRATATLMQRFYEHYRDGADPARTLAAAQRAMLAVPATANPYYWAGFEVVGGR